MKLSQIRQDYGQKVLLEKHITSDPILFFKQWLQEAMDLKVNEPTAMTLSTVDKEGKPSARIVLLKYLSDEGFAFFTNYESAKGQHLASNPYAALSFFWPELERQVRIEGKAVKTSEELSDKYFNSRPYESRLSAFVSPQSQVVPDREFLDELWKTEKEKYADEHLQRPMFWGGYLVKPYKIEFWQGRSNRLHDRLAFELRENRWIMERLAP